MDIKRRNGEYIGAFAAYGYLKDEENKNHLVIDDYAADVVRDIFTMKLCGMSQQSIADIVSSFSKVFQVLPRSIISTLQGGILCENYQRLC